MMHSVELLFPPSPSTHTFAQFHTVHKAILLSVTLFSLSTWFGSTVWSICKLCCAVRTVIYRCEDYALLYASDLRSLPSSIDHRFPTDQKANLQARKNVRRNQTDKLNLLNRILHSRDDQLIGTSSAKKRYNSQGKRWPLANTIFQSDIKTVAKLVHPNVYAFSGRILFPCFGPPTLNVPRTFAVGYGLQ